MKNKITIFQVAEKIKLRYSSFSAGKTTGYIFGETSVLTNAVVGLIIGILVTVLVQSSSTSTSVVTTMVGARSKLNIDAFKPNNMWLVGTARFFLVNETTVNNATGCHIGEPERLLEKLETKPPLPGCQIDKKTPKSVMCRGK